MIFGKVWGTTRELFSHGGVECHRLFVKKGHSCSLHSHLKKNNAFYVESGRLIIEVHKNNYDLVDYTDLVPGERTEVCCGENHRFIAVEDTVALEWYWKQENSSIFSGEKDIARENVGHKLSSSDMSDILKCL